MEPCGWLGPVVRGPYKADIHCIFKCRLFVFCAVRCGPLPVLHMSVAISLVLQHYECAHFLFALADTGLRELAHVWLLCAPSAAGVCHCERSCSPGTGRGAVAGRVRRQLSAGPGRGARETLVKPAPPADRPGKRRCFTCLPAAAREAGRGAPPTKSCRGTPAAPREGRQPADLSRA